MKSGVLNGRIEGFPAILITVAYHTGEKRYFVSPKFPGNKTIPVRTQVEGMRIAEKVYLEFVKALLI